MLSSRDSERSALAWPRRCLPRCSSPSPYKPATAAMLAFLHTMPRQSQTHSHQHTSVRQNLGEHIHVSTSAVTQYHMYVSILLPTLNFYLIRKIWTPSLVRANHHNWIIVSCHKSLFIKLLLLMLRWPRVFHFARDSFAFCCGNYICQFKINNVRLNMIQKVINYAVLSNVVGPVRFQLLEFHIQ